MLCISYRYVFNHAKVGNANKKRLVLPVLAAERLSRDYDRARESDSHHKGDSSGSCKFLHVTIQFKPSMHTYIAISAFES